MNSQDQKKELLKKNALAFHRFPIPGKISVNPTKEVRDQNELALAYTPGVACACEEIHADPENAYIYTTKGNLVAVISNGYHRLSGTHFRRYQSGRHSRT